MSSATTARAGSRRSRCPVASTSRRRSSTCAACAPTASTRESGCPASSGWRTATPSSSTSTTPLGLAAYHHLARVAQGVNALRGVYVMGKAATLNGRVGDVMVSSSIYDEHSRNTYLMRNCFTADHVQPFMEQGTVLDNQKAV